MSWILNVNKLFFVVMRCKLCVGMEYIVIFEGERKLVSGTYGINVPILLIFAKISYHNT